MMSKNRLNPPMSFLRTLAENATLPTKPSLIRGVAWVDEWRWHHAYVHPYCTHSARFEGSAPIVRVHIDPGCYHPSQSQIRLWANCIKVPLFVLERKTGSRPMHLKLTALLDELPALARWLPLWVHCHDEGDFDILPPAPVELSSPPESSYIWTTAADRRYLAMRAKRQAT